jgi:hypothetical protein
MGWSWNSRGSLEPGIYRGVILQEKAPPDLIPKPPAPERWYNSELPDHYQVAHLISDTGNLAGSWLSYEPAYPTFQAQAELWATMQSVTELKLSDHAWLVVQDLEHTQAWLKQFPSACANLQPLKTFKKAFLYIGLDGIKAHHVLDRWKESNEQ